MEKIEFEKFVSTGKRFSEYIGFNMSGGFSFSSGFYRKNSVKRFPYVTLFYAKKDRAIGFLFTKQRESGSLKLAHRLNNASVRSNSFLSAYNIQPKSFAGRYPVQQYNTDSEESLFYITLGSRNK